MNTTNRALNRLFILIVGLLLIAAGTAAILLGTVPAAAAWWRAAASRLVTAPQPWVADPAVGRASLLVAGVVVLALVLILLLIAFIARQGRGRSAAGFQHRAGGTSTRIDVAVLRTLLEEHLQQRPELVGLRITAHEVRTTPMLKITARCRRGVSPAGVSALVGRAIADLETIVGVDVPAFVQLTGGFRAGSRALQRVA